MDAGGVIGKYLMGKEMRCVKWEGSVLINKCEGDAVCRLPKQLRKKKFKKKTEEKMGKGMCSTSSCLPFKME